MGGGDGGGGDGCQMNAVQFKGLIGGKDMILFVMVDGSELRPW